MSVYLPRPSWCKTVRTGIQTDAHPPRRPYKAVLKVTLLLSYPAFLLFVTNLLYFENIIRWAKIIVWFLV